MILEKLYYSSIKIIVLGKSIRQLELILQQNDELGLLAVINDPQIFYHQKSTKGLRS